MELRTAISVCEVNGKGKAVSVIIKHHTMTSVNFALTLGWRCVISFTPRPLYPRGGIQWSDTHWKGRQVGPRAGLDAVVGGIKSLDPAWHRSPIPQLTSPWPSHYTG
jgi:hypothetical protein